MLYEVITSYIPAVEKGVREALGEGILAGYPIVDVKVTVYDGSYHDVDSSEMAFKIAASMGFKTAVSNAKPRITSYNVCYTKLLRDMASTLYRFIWGMNPAWAQITLLAMSRNNFV